MPRNPEAFADMVVMTVKAALGPLLERIAATEQTNRELQARVAELVGLRDRLTVVETKAAQPIPVAPDVDLSPLLERLVAAEQANRELQARLVEISGIRDRLTAVETKAAQPAPAIPEFDVSPVLERVAGVEARLSALGDLRDRVVTIETKSLQSVPELIAPPSGPSASDLELSMRDKLEPLAKEVGALRERLIAVEVRQPTPGPPGPPGKDGTNGLNGKDGADGLGFDDLAVEFDGDRTIALKFQRGDLKRVWPIVLPYMKYQGVYQQGKAYELGDTVSWASQVWYCQEPTTTPPGDGSKCWQLCVRKGRDGRDGRDAPTVPVVSVGGGR